MGRCSSKAGGRGVSIEQAIKKLGGLKHTMSDFVITKTLMPNTTSDLAQEAQNILETYKSKEINKISLTSLPLSKIETRQGGVAESGVIKYLKGEIKSETPPTVVQVGSHYVLIDGNTRTTAALLLGKKSMDFRVIKKK